MNTPKTKLPIPVAAQEKVVKYLESAFSTFISSNNMRTQMEARDKEYQRTNNLTETQRKAAAANKGGDAAKIQDMVVPVVMPQVETRLASLQETFLSGHPIFGVVAPPDQQDAIAQMEAIIESNSTTGGWANELLLALRDGLKYDLGAVEVCWEDRKLYSVGTPALSDLTRGQEKETYYKGNFIKRLDPYNLILDTSVSPERLHEDGEFAGYTEMYSRIRLKKLMENLRPEVTMNFTAALESPGPGITTSNDTNSPYYEPQINPDSLLPTSLKREQNWLGWLNLDAPSTGTPGANNSSSYEVTTLYARLIPADVGIPTPTGYRFVQIWKFIIINRKVVILAERQTNAHNLLPIVIAKPSNDGLKYQSKSFAENVTPVQNISSALVNSALESQRRKVYDRLLYDPSRINKADIDKVSSVSRIPVKNSQYGKQLSDAVYPFPYRDDGVAEILSLSQNIIQMGDIANGTNRVQQGQFQKGNKTRREFDTTMMGASSRDRLAAMGLEFTFFQPIKTIIKTNILQFQPPGNVLNPDTQSVVTVDPALLRKAGLEFKLSDGYLPSDKIINTEVMGSLFNAAGALPQIAVEYDLMGMLIYSLKLQGANWLNSFKRSQADQAAAMAQMQQAATAAGTRNPPPEKPSEPTT
jgi:hypothetical protein